MDEVAAEASTRRCLRVGELMVSACVGRTDAGGMYPASHGPEVYLTATNMRLLVVPSANGNVFAHPWSDYRSVDVQRGFRRSLMTVTLHLTGIPEQFSVPTSFVKAVHPWF